MVARWMQAKRLKQARERRAWAKPYSIKSSAGPNWHNGKIAHDTSLDLNEERRLNAIKETRQSRVPSMDELREILGGGNGPMLITTRCDTPYHRCRIFFNHRMTKYVLQYVVWSERKARISIAYPSATRAWQAFLNDRVIWRKTIPF